MRAKKHLGQNFLKSEAALRKIIEAGGVHSHDTILEIGPGTGILTERLLERAGLVIAVEKDADLVNFLKAKFKNEIGSRSLILVHEDILDLDIESWELLAKGYKLIANIPYNITGAILKKFLSAARQPEQMVLMVQYEVARRIIGVPASGKRSGTARKESLLSISVKAYGTPEFVMKVPARYFSPAPKVDSGIIAIRGISRTIFEENGISEEKFWKLVKHGFAHKRKMLASNLKNLLKEEQRAVFEKYGNKRAEDLALRDWIALAHG